MLDSVEVPGGGGVADMRVAGRRDTAGRHAARPAARAGAKTKAIVAAQRGGPGTNSTEANAVLGITCSRRKVVYDAVEIYVRARLEARQRHGFCSGDRRLAFWKTLVYPP